MLMTIKSSRGIYQDPIVCTLELIRYECFVNHIVVLSYDEFCAQNCTCFHARLINEGHCAWFHLKWASIFGAYVSNIKADSNCVARYFLIYKRSYCHSNIKYCYHTSQNSLTLCRPFVHYTCSNVNVFCIHSTLNILAENSRYAHNCELVNLLF